MSGRQPSPVERLAVGGRLGPYVLKEKLGEGGMGLVFRAVVEPGGKTVALKVLREELSHDETYRRRFAHEVRAAREVRHDHLVPVLEAGEADGYHYIAVAFIAGPSLAARLKENPMPLVEITTLVSEVAAGLDALHNAGLVHRDVKPANVMIDANGRAALTDLGLAKGRAYTVLTPPGQVVGTIDYLAPEIINQSAASSASDIYALGCTAFECIAGYPPFASKSLLQVAFAHLEEMPPDLSAVRQDVSPALSWAVMQALVKDPALRPGTATEYASGLERAVSPTPRP